MVHVTSAFHWLSPWRRRTRVYGIVGDGGRDELLMQRVCFLFALSDARLYGVG